MTSFFKENLEAPAALPVVRSLLRGKKTETPRKKASSYEYSDEDSLEDEKPQSKKKFCQYQEKCSHLQTNALRSRP